MFRYTLLLESAVGVIQDLRKLSCWHTLGDLVIALTEWCLLRQFDGRLPFHLAPRYLGDTWFLSLDNRFTHNLPNARNVSPGWVLNVFQGRVNFVDNRWPRGQPLLTRQLFADETPCPIPSKRSHHFDTDTTPQVFDSLKPALPEKRGAALPPHYRTTIGYNVIQYGDVEK